MAASNTFFYNLNATSLFKKFANLQKNSTLTIKPVLNTLTRVAFVELTALFGGTQLKLIHNSQILLSPIEHSAILLFIFSPCCCLLIFKLRFN
jgi:hypothetical protein